MVRDDRPLRLIPIENTHAERAAKALGEARAATKAAEHELVAALDKAAKLAAVVKGMELARVGVKERATRLVDSLGEEVLNLQSLIGRNP